MKTFYVLWTYVANYSKLMEIKAASAEDAAKACTAFFSDDFKAKGNVYVFDSPPAFAQVGGAS